VRQLSEMEAAAGQWAPELIKAPAASEAAAKEYFKRTSFGVAITMLFLTIGIMLTPKPDPKKEELIPEEFAKVLLSPTIKKLGANPGGDNRSGSASNNVVQAFKS